MRTPRPVRIPPALAGSIGAAIGAGALYGAATASGERRSMKRLLRGSFFASAFGYLTVSVLDFWEHARLEKKASGRYIAAKAVPIGETINHALTVGTLLTTLVLARPLPLRPQLRDWLSIAALPVYVALGWRDELLFHRKRSKHREDMMHTVAHLAAAGMLGAHYGLRAIDEEVSSESGS